jgi:hypothetical protein
VGGAMLSLYNKLSAQLHNEMNQATEIVCLYLHAQCLQVSKAQDTAVGIHWADCVTPTIRKSWQ